MNDRTTHNKIAHSLFPYMSPRFVDYINARIDNPTAFDMAWQRFMDRASNVQSQRIGFYPGMGSKDIMGFGQGHRKYNHNLNSALMMSFMAGGTPAMQVFLSHMMADKLSDQMVRQHSTEYRNLFEAMYNMMTRRLQRRW